MTLQARLPALFLAMVVLGAGPLRAAAPPSQFGVDAPELAPLGELAVGVRTLALIQRNQEDVLAFDPAKGLSPRVTVP